MKEWERFLDGCRETRISPRKRIRLWIASVILTVLLSLLLWPIVEPLLGKQFPSFAWRYGTPQMQRYAAQVLITKVTPGMSYQAVLAILGPGSCGWPSLKARKLAPGDTVGFNVRAPRNNGIDVGFRNGKVVSTFYYD